MSVLKKFESNDVEQSDKVQVLSWSGDLNFTGAATINTVGVVIKRIGDLCVMRVGGQAFTAGATAILSSQAGEIPAAFYKATQPATQVETIVAKISAIASQDGKADITNTGILNIFANVQGGGFTSGQPSGFESFDIKWIVS